MSESKAKASKGENAELLETINERFKYAAEEWQDIRDEGAIDMRYIGGDPWDPRERKAREDACRPILSLDELNQYVNQLINEIRQNKRAIQVTPVGSGADDDSARLRADLIRQIEYRSNAQQAYTTMFENTVQRSYGFLRVKPKYVHATPPKVNDRIHPSAFEQELLIEPIVNPDLVYIDPDIQKPDGSDMKYAFIFEWRTKKEFSREFPKAEIQDFSAPELKIQAPLFIKDDAILLAEYWVKQVKRTRELLLLDTMEGPQAFYADELETVPGDEHVLNRMDVDETEVWQYLTNGVEILKKTKWDGPDIPLVCCFGKVLYLDEGEGSKRKILSMVRLARDPYMLYCYYRTAEAEQVGMSTKFPYFVREGSLSPAMLTNIAKSLHEPVAAIEVRATADGMPPGQMPEMPVRNPFEPAIQALEIGAEGARRAIQAAIGQSPLPSSAQRRNEKSGVALKQIDESAQKGSYHFIDHYEIAVTRCGTLINDLLPFYYDTARDVTVRGDDDTAKQVRINDDAQPDPKTGKVPTITADQHDVTLSTGPSYDSERELASDFTDTLVQNIQMVAAVAGPPAAGKVLSLAVKLKNLGAIGTKIADTISPPEQEGQPQIPPELQQQMAQMQAENAQLKELADKNRTDLVKTQMQQQAESQRAQLEFERDLRVEEMKNAASIRIAEINAAVKGYQTEAQHAAQHEQQALNLSAQQASQVAESHEAENQRAHEQQMADRQHAQTMEQADQGAAHASEQMQQQAALNPPAERA